MFKRSDLSNCKQISEIHGQHFIKKSGNLLLRLFETIAYVCSSFPKKGERGILWVFAFTSSCFYEHTAKFHKTFTNAQGVQFKTHPERFTESKALILEGYGNVA